MDTTIILVYCLCDDLLKAHHHRDDVQCQVSDAEIMTTGLVAALYFQGNHAQSTLFLSEQGYMHHALSRSRFCRRLKRVRPYYTAFFGMLGAYFKEQNDALPYYDDKHPPYAIDSMPMPVCDNARIRRCRIYPKAVHHKRYHGYVASKRRYYYGLKLNLMVAQSGAPVEFFLTPASFNDVTCLQWYDFDLVPNSVIYADGAYNHALIEELCKEYGIDLSPMRRANAKRKDAGWLRYLKAVGRKCIETTYSLIAALLPRSIHAVTAEGFETKVGLFVLAVSIQFLMQSR